MRDLLGMGEQVLAFTQLDFRRPAFGDVLRHSANANDLSLFVGDRHRPRMEHSHGTVRAEKSHFVIERYALGPGSFDIAATAIAIIRMNQIQAPVARHGAFPRFEAEQSVEVRGPMQPLGPQIKFPTPDVGQLLGLGQQHLAPAQALFCLRTGASGFRLRLVGALPANPRAGRSGALPRTPRMGTHLAAALGDIRKEFVLKAFYMRGNLLWIISAA